jgi:hypothetical protein
LGRQVDVGHARQHLLDRLLGVTQALRQRVRFMPFQLEDIHQEVLIWVTVLARRT